MIPFAFPKPTKFRNKPTKCAQLLRHASRLEAWRCDELHMLQRTGVIAGLAAHPQPRFPLEVNGTKVTTYVADFTYYRNDAPDRMVIEDVKGMETPEFKLKKRLFEAIHGTEITVVKATRQS